MYIYIYNYVYIYIFIYIYISIYIYIYTVKCPKLAIAVQSGPLRKYNISSRREAEITLFYFIFPNCIRIWTYQGEFERQYFSKLNFIF